MEGETEVIPPQVGVTWEVLSWYVFVGLPSILCGMRMILCDVKLGSLKQWWSELPSYILQAVTVPVQFSLHHVIDSKLEGFVNMESETEVIPPQVGVTWEVLYVYICKGLPSILCGMRMILWCEAG